MTTLLVNILKGRVKHLNITDVRIRLVNKPDSKLLGVATFTIDNVFVVHDVKIIAGNNGNFIAMPSRQTPDGEYKDIVHPLNTETREKIRDLVLKAFDEAKAKQDQE